MDSGTQVPLWVAIAGSFGVGALIGNLAPYLLSSRLQRRHWLFDNKKAEWRELIDELHKCFEMLGYAFRCKAFIEDSREIEEERKTASQGAVRGSQVINNRIYIAEVLNKHDIHRKWSALIEMTQVDEAELPKTARKFVDAFNALPDEVLKLARQDLPVRS